MDYYDYDELLKIAISTNAPEDLMNLGEWFERNYTDSWTGECFKVNSSLNLYPIYNDDLDIIGYEFHW